MTRQYEHFINGKWAPPADGASPAELQALLGDVFYDADNAPSFLRDIAEGLPLVHVIDGLSGAMVTGSVLAAGEQLHVRGVRARDAGGARPERGVRAGPEAEERLVEAT